MNKKIETLCEFYEEANVNVFTKTSMLAMLCKTRNKAYNMAFLSVQEYDFSEDIKSESLAYCSFLTDVARNPELTKSVFDNTMTIVANMNNATFHHLDEDSQLEVLESEIGMVREVFKTLKKNPHKAGIKIKSAKFALNSLIDQKEDLIERIEERKESLGSCEIIEQKSDMSM